VIHRDLKPGNILVSEEGEVKLLDFGVAKLLNPELGGTGPTQTQAALRVMTPEYASPEQVRGQHVTTATDIYSLGVILYQLLTGARPYKLNDSSPEELSRVICESEPSKPSQVVSGQQSVVSGTADLHRQETAHNEQITNPKSKIQNLKSLRGDIDNIVLMALRKDPARRYRSVEQFSADIERHLKGLPVIARKDTFNYRATKFARRNRVGVAAAAIILLLLLGGIVATALQARAIARQAQMAQHERAKAESINAVLEQMLNYSNPVLNSSSRNGRETTMTEVLDEAARRLEGPEFANQPEVRAELERIIGISYYGQGRYALGAEHLQEYVVLEKGLYGENHPRTLAASVILAALLFERGEMVEAEKLFRQSLPLMRIAQQKGNIKAEVLLDALSSFGYLRRTQGDSREAEALFREALALRPQVPVEARYSLGITRSTLASTLADQGRFDEAVQTAREAVAETRQRGNPNRPDLGFSLTVLGGFLSDKGDFAAADAALLEAETIFRRLLQPSHLWLGTICAIKLSLSIARAGLSKRKTRSARLLRSILRVSASTMTTIRLL
jgi:tetratricopeptide (TPR) repeat protein